MAKLHFNLQKKNNYPQVQMGQVQKGPHKKTCQKLLNTPQTIRHSLGKQPPLKRQLEQNNVKIGKNLWHSKHYLHSIDLLLYLIVLALAWNIYPLLHFGVLSLAILFLFYLDHISRLLKQKPRISTAIRYFLLITITIFVAISVGFVTKSETNVVVEKTSSSLSTSSKQLLDFCSEVVSPPRRPSSGKISLEVLLVTPIRARVLLNAGDLPWNYISLAGKGDYLCGKATVRGLSKQSANSSYDRYLIKRGFGGEGKLSVVHKLITSKKNTSGVSDFIEMLFLEYGARDSLAILSAAVLGVREVLPYEIKDLFKSTGTTHLLVVSGFHVGVVFLFISTIASFTLLTSKSISVTVVVDKFAAFIGLLGACFYVWIVGIQPTTVRALCFLVVYVIGKSLGRNAISLRTLIVSGYLVSILYPGGFYEPGVQLTFSAITGLLWSDFVFRTYFRDTSNLKLTIRLLRVLFSCTGAWLFTSPIVLYWFNGFVPLAPLFNFLLIWPFSILCIGIGGVLFLLLRLSIPFAEELFVILLNLIDNGVVLFYRLNEFIGELGFGFIEISNQDINSYNMPIYITVLTLSLLSILQRRYPLKNESGGAKTPKGIFAQSVFLRGIQGKP